MSMLIEINRGPNGEPGDLVDPHAYIRQLKARLAEAEGQAEALQYILAAARLIVDDSTEGDDGLTTLSIPQGTAGTERIQVLVDAVRAYDRRAQP